MASSGKLKENSDGTIGLAVSNSDHFQAPPKAGTGKDSLKNRRAMNTAHTAAVKGSKCSVCMCLCVVYSVVQLMVVI